MSLLKIREFEECTFKMNINPVFLLFKLKIKSKNNNNKSLFVNFNAAQKHDVHTIT